MDIVVGFDGSSPAMKALNLAKEHAKAFNAKIHLVTSLKGGHGERQEDIDKAKSDLKSAKKLLQDNGISCEEHLLIRGMDPGEDIVDFADEKKADVIFIGVLRTSKVAKLLLGSNAQYVILQATCPVITVK
jgi:nucleotide-binding universal stress UspA family protein